MSFIYQILHYGGALLSSPGGLYYLLTSVVFVYHWKTQLTKGFNWLARPRQNSFFLETWTVYWFFCFLLTSIGLTISTIEGLNFNYNRDFALLSGFWAFLHFTFLWFGVLLNISAPKRPLLSTPFGSKKAEAGEVSYLRAARSLLPLYLLIVMFVAMPSLLELFSSS